MATKSDRELNYRCFCTMLETTHDMQFYKTPDLIYVNCSLPFAKMAGKDSIEEIVGKTDYDLFDLELAQKYIFDDIQVLSTKKPKDNIIESLPEKNGLKRYCSTSKHIVYGDSGEIVGLYGSSVDITASIQLQEEKEANSLSNRLYLSVIEADLTEDRLLSYQSVVSIFNFPDFVKNKVTYSQYIENYSTRFVEKLFVEDFIKTFSLKNLTANFHDGTTTASFRTQLNYGEKAIWAVVRTDLYYSQVSGTLRAKVCVKDVSELVEREIELINNAEQDVLTGLFDRRAVISNVTNCIAVKRENDKHAMLFIDIDNFKQVNDNYGHHFGDKVLKGVAQILRKICDNNCIIGRVGGDEFLVFSKNTDRDGARILMEKICNGFVEYAEITADEKNRISCSIGCSLFANDDKTFNQMYDESDQAMYLAKRYGKNTFCFFIDN